MRKSYNILIKGNKKIKLKGNKKACSRWNKAEAQYKIIKVIVLRKPLPCK